MHLHYILLKNSIFLIFFNYFLSLHTTIIYSIHSSSKYVKNNKQLNTKLIMSV